MIEGRDEVVQCSSRNLDLWSKWSKLTRAEVNGISADGDGPFCANV